MRHCKECDCVLVDDEQDVCEECMELLLEEEIDLEEEIGEIDDIDESMDGDFDSGMTSAGFGTDEDYGFYGGDFDEF